VSIRTRLVIRCVLYYAAGSRDVLIQ